MRWAIFLGSATVGGGTYVIFQHAIYAKKMGVDVTIITMETVDKSELYWHKEAEILTWKTIDEAASDEYDIVISTWWRLVYEAYRVKAKCYIYFVQSIESKFYVPSEKPIRQLAEATYMLPMRMITEATWIKDYIYEHYDKVPELVYNGIRKDIYTCEGECYAPREKGKLRVLVEGPVDVDFKNVPKTVGICMNSKADEIWLLTCSDIKEYPGVDRVFSKVPIYETPKIYRSCDVIIKLSYVEGMFGPPLEMFHCGGTAITYDVTGHDEYIVNGYNALVAQRDDDNKVLEYINRLKDDEEYLNKLKLGAIDTAEKWIGWDESSKRFYETVEKIYEEPGHASQSRIEKESKFHFDSYVIAEDYLNDIKAANFPLKQILWKKIKRNVRKYIKKPTV